MRKRKSRILTVIWVTVIMTALVFCLGCQGQTQPTEEGAAAPVVIEEEAETETAEEASPTVEEAVEEAMPVITQVFTPKSSKDPFIPVVGPPGSTLPPAQEAPVGIVDTPPVGEETPVDPDARPVPVKPVEKPAAPQITELTEEQAGVSVQGIMAVGGKRTAILRSSAGSSYLVENGTKLGDWVVSSIGEKTVTLTSKGYVAKLTLKTDIGSPGKALTSDQGTHDAPKAPAAPEGTDGAPGGKEQAPPPPIN